MRFENFPSLLMDCGYLSHIRVQARNPHPQLQLDSARTFGQHAGDAAQTVDQGSFLQLQERPESSFGKFIAGS